MTDTIFGSNKLHRRSCHWNRSILRKQGTHVKPSWKSIGLAFGFSQECHPSSEVRCRHWDAQQHEAISFFFSISRATSCYTSIVKIANKQNRMSVYLTSMINFRSDFQKSRSKNVYAIIYLLNLSWHIFFVALNSEILQLTLRILPEEVRWVLLIYLLKCLRPVPSSFSHSSTHP